MPDSFSTTSPQLVDVIAGVLAERGPTTEEQLVSLLSDRGVALGDDEDYALAEALEDGEGLLTVLGDGRWVSLPALLAGRAFAHRLTGPEVEHDILDTHPDLSPVDMLVERVEYQRLADGPPVAGVFPDDDADNLAERGVPPEVVGDLGALLLPSGYLRGKGLGEGSVIAVRVTDDGLLLEAAADQVPAERLAGLGRGLTEVLAAGSEEPALLDVAVWTACAEDPALFTEPLPPLREALDACGLAYDDEWLAPSGFDFRRWRANARRAAIARRYDLDDEASFAVLVVATMYERVASEGHEAGDASVTSLDEAESAAFSTVAPMLAEAAVAEAVLGETTGIGKESAAALRMFAETLEPEAPRSARPALRWLRGKAFEQLGDVTAAEADYQAAESLDPRWAPALVDLARFAGDRGDAARGLALLRRADAPPDHALVELLERFQAEARTDIGRNDACWCGSGRKYKKCHLNRESLTLDERAAWLYQKAGVFLEDGPWRIAVMETAQTRAEFSDSSLGLLEALDDPLTADAVLFEGGAFAEFVATRGALLPEDELLLAEQWLLVERSVYDIEQLSRGEGFTARDVRTGDAHQVRERVASRQLELGALICARIVPTGDTTQIFGGIEPVALHERDELIELLDAKPGPLELVSFLSRRFAPPVLQNTEGDPLVLCEVTLRTEAPAALADELDETYERGNDADAPQWSEYITTDGMRRVRATLRLDGHHLTVQANSEARVDRVLDVLRALDATLTVVGQSREAAELPSGGTSADSLAPVEPEFAAVLDQFVRDYEQKWLDEPIPALAGYTPRQAAADPTRRGDLIRLLDSFPDHCGKSGVMDTDRLRAALGLGLPDEP